MQIPMTKKLKIHATTLRKITDQGWRHRMSVNLASKAATAAMVAKSDMSEGRRVLLPAPVSCTALLVCRQLTRPGFFATAVTGATLFDVRSENCFGVDGVCGGDGGTDGGPQPMCSNQAEFQPGASSTRPKAFRHKSSVL